MKILAIETSCDETAAAVVRQNKNGGIAVISEAVASSEEMHAKTGGVIPEVAAREQLRSVLPVVREVVIQAMGGNVGEKRKFGKELVEKSWGKEDAWVKKNIDAVAVTVGPGLVGSLLVGVETAKTLAWVWNKPLIPVNHLLAHLYANWVVEEEEGGRKSSVPDFPALGLVVSGGHTDLVWLSSHDKIELLGSTRDDAAGECLDKCARVLGLPYPGGPAIAKQARLWGEKQNSVERGGKKISLPRPLIKEKSFDFSFSGMKVAVKRLVDEAKKDGTKIDEELKSRLAREIEEAVVEVLVERVVRKIGEGAAKSLLLGGGVAANEKLRKRLLARVKEVEHHVDVWVPQIKYCTDNAVMVGARAFFEKEKLLDEVNANPSMEIVD